MKWCSNLRCISTVSKDGNVSRRGDTGQQASATDAGCCIFRGICKGIVITRREIVIPNHAREGLCNANFAFQLGHGEGRRENAGLRSLFLSQTASSKGKFKFAQGRDKHGGGSECIRYGNGAENG